MDAGAGAGVRGAGRPRRGRRWAAGAVLAAGLTLLGACSGGYAGGGAPEAAAPSDTAAGSTGNADVGTGTAPGRGGGGAADAALEPVLAGRDVVVQGTVTVAADDLAAAARSAADAAVRSGGYVQEESAELSGSADLLDGGDPESAGVRLVLRVPTEAFGRVRDQVAALGEEVARSTTSDDVTEQVLDVESRLATQRASVERVRALLERATDLSEVVAVEAELTRRQADLESLEARSVALASQVRLATLEVRLVPPGTVLADATAPGFLDGLARGWDAFDRALAVVATVAGLLLPFLAAAGLLALPVLLLRRRRAPRPGADTLPAA